MERSSTRLFTYVWVNKLPFLDWVTSSASYTGTYRWTASSRSTQSIMGNLNENEASLQINGNADFTKLYNKVPYFKKITTPKRTNRNSRQQKEKTVADSTAKTPKKNYAKLVGDNMVRLLLSVKKASFSF